MALPQRAPSAPLAAASEAAASAASLRGEEDEEEERCSPLVAAGVCVSPAAAPPSAEGQEDEAFDGAASVSSTEELGRQLRPPGYDGDCLECRQHVLSVLGVLGTGERAHAHAEVPSGAEEDAAPLSLVELQLLMAAAGDAVQAEALLRRNAAELLLLLMQHWILPATEYLGSAAGVQKLDGSSASFVAARRTEAVCRAAGISVSVLTEHLLGAAANLVSAEPDADDPEGAAAAEALEAALPLAAEVFALALLVCTDAGSLREAFRGIAASLGFRHEQRRQLSLQQQVQLARKKRLLLVRLAPTEEAAQELLSSCLYVVRQALHAPLLRMAAHCLSLLLALEDFDMGATAGVAAAAESAARFRKRSSGEAATAAAAPATPVESRVEEILGATPPLVQLLRRKPQRRLLLLVSVERAAELLRLPGLPDTASTPSMDLSVPARRRAAVFMQLLQQQMREQPLLDEEQSTALSALVLLSADLLKRDPLLLLQRLPNGLPKPLITAEMLIQIGCCSCMCCGDDRALEAALLLLLAVEKNGENAGTKADEGGDIDDPLAIFDNDGEASPLLTGTQPSEGNSEGSRTEGHKPEKREAASRSAPGSENTSSKDSSTVKHMQDMAAYVRGAIAAYCQELLDAPVGADVIERTMLLLQEEPEYCTEHERGASVLLLLQHAKSSQIEIYKTEVQSLMRSLKNKQF
ncbi:hypothetical protein cyc_08554 [Cyclospora cayetanensis]|uniref:Uncharacterized protein n=1 Tax=Cyclospora cayetanensis TaxID=88456 RepID=A0A1D3D383_9EIME|nr:hypothetical protein cyc_08554 [Cyclospora cayetanensis]